MSRVKKRSQWGNLEFIKPSRARKVLMSDSIGVTGSPVRAGGNHKFDLVWWCGHFQSSFDGGPMISPSLLTRLGEFGVLLFIDQFLDHFLV